MARGFASEVELSVVVPLYDEEAVVGELVRRLAAVLDTLALDGAAEVILVDDGSRDGTAAAIARAARADRRFRGVLFSRNFGHQAAISAGLAESRGRTVAVLDGDLQDPPEALPELLARLAQGFDVVYAIRARRPEPLWKRALYKAAYRLVGRRAGSEVAVPRDAGDFSVMTRRVVDLLVAMPERRRYLRGLRAWVGFRQAGVPVDRQPRHAGRPKYTLGKLAALALDGVVGFGPPPLRMAGILGFATALTGLGGLVLCLLVAVAGRAPDGWAWVASAVVFFGGAQLVCAAVLGEYLDRVHRDAGGRPLYVVRGRLGSRSRRSPDSVKVPSVRREVVVES